MINVNAEFNKMRSQCIVKKKREDELSSKRKTLPNIP